MIDQIARFSLSGAAKVAACGLLAGLAMGSPAIAAENSAGSAVQSYTLSYAPGDLQSTAAVHALHKKIRRIARQNCPVYGISRELKASAECRAQIEADLVSRINHPTLSALHSGTRAPALAVN